MMDMDMRQKIIAGFLALAVVMVIWQIYTLLVTPTIISQNKTKSISALDITKANKNDYTVQLIAKKTPSDVNAFISNNKLGGNALTLKTNYAGKLWYIGLYGDFLTVDEANKAMEKLPSPAKTQKPFVRRIGDVLKGVEK